MTVTLLPSERSAAEVLPELVLVAEHAKGRRARRDERLDHVFEERCDWIDEYGRPDQLAVDSHDLRLTYHELDARTNQLARYLRLSGASAGDRIALLFVRPVDAYLGMLAVLKIGAAYVPLDVGSPADRLAYIVADAQVTMVQTHSDVRDRVEHIKALTAPDIELLFIDDAAPLIAELNECRLLPVERGSHQDQLAYIIYTSGSTDRPERVAIDHPSICNFVRVAAETYGIRLSDRVYQGLTVAFDFSVVEIWVPWVAGATLVPKPPGVGLQGQDLHEFLSERRVTAMCCVPALLATIEDDLPNLGFLLVSGEACPQDLVARWHKTGRRFLNVYGPAEATVTDPYRALIELTTGTERDLATALAEPVPTPIENNLAEVLADIVRIERVSVDSHFFDDLGADSMVMARFCARVRKRADLPTVSMKDIYQHPTIRSLATALAEPTPTPIESSLSPSLEVATHVARGGRLRLVPTGTPRYVLCGTLQLLFFLGYCYLAALLTARGSEWISAGSGLISIYLRTVLFGAASFLGVCTLPILAKWMLIGRWKPQEIRIWSLAYVRFWIVKTLVRSNPLVRFGGSPLYVLYLRALGAKVGRGVAIFSRTVPCALTCSPSATARSSVRTRPSPATEPTPA